MKNVAKAEGAVVVLLVRQERLQSFAQVWRKANLDFYQTQQS